MGTRGPVGKRSDERIRRNTPESKGQLPIAKGEGNYEYDRPEPDEDWHPIALMLWEGLEDSGMSEFYQLSDWAAAYLLCENLSRELKPQFVGFQDRWNLDADQMEHLPTRMTIPLKGGNLSAMLKMFATLGITEGDRRRMMIELSREVQVDPDAAADSSVVDARARFGAS